MTLEPVRVGLGWFAGETQEGRYHQRSDDRIRTADDFPVREVIALECLIAA